jgi:hypothetical protein
MKTLVLALHVLVGTLSLGTGLYALVGPKTAAGHRRAGVAFFACMAGICATALWLSLARGSWFLLQVDGLSWYFAWTGWLALARSGLREGDRAPRSHLVPPIALTVWSLGWGLYGIRNAHGLTIAFALLGLAASVPDLARLVAPTKRRQQWLVDHVIGFAGAFVASVTALVVVNAGHVVGPTFQHRWLFWIAPPVVGFAWIALHARRMRTSSRPATASLRGRTSMAGG